MQDRFKFRAKLKSMDKWVYGVYLKMLPYQPNPVGKTKPLEIEYKHLIITEGSADWGMPREITAYEVIPETVGQCTGLKDKNSKLIYEGDILGDIYEGLYIHYCIHCHQFQLYSQGYGCMACNGDVHWIEVVEDNKKLEVIGNIYQDSHLLDNSNIQ